jgi:hypothetical protein
MESFTIRMDFRGRRVNANVHQHEAFYLIWFSDTEIVHSFGGQIQLSADLKTMSGHRSGADDEKKLHNAIVHELKKLDH